MPSPVSARSAAASSRRLTRAGTRLAARAGRRARDRRHVSARDKTKKREFRDHELGRRSAAHWREGDADVVVELIGGEDGIAPDAGRGARSNPASMSSPPTRRCWPSHGAALAELAEEKGVALKFEAAVAGGIPIVKALRESLIAYGVDAVRGILNGTCNYILTANGSDGAPLRGRARRKRSGWAMPKPIPTLDVGGGDTAHKLALLSSLAFGTAPDLAYDGGRGHRAHHARRHRVRARVRLPHQASGRRAANAAGHRSARAARHGAMRARRSPMSNGAFNAVVGGCGRGRAVLFRRPRRGRGADRLRRHCRFVDIARGQHRPGIRPSRRIL